MLPRFFSALLALVTLMPLLALQSSAWAAEEPVIEPFNGTDLSGWKTKPGMSKWKVGAARMAEASSKRLAVTAGGQELVNDVSGHGESVDIYSEALHGDATIKLEVMVPLGANSGIYVMGEYEVQVLDSYGKDAKPGPGDMGAVYGASPPTRPKYVAPGQWNTYEIQWRAPRMDAAGKKTSNAKFVKVVLNGTTIHQDLEMKGPTPGGLDGKEKAKGPLMFQGDHGPVAFRNIRIRPAQF